MPPLPPPIIRIVSTFAPLFSRRVVGYVEVLLTGALLTPGRRTITSVLRIMGLQHTRQFQNYHRVLNRAHWSSRKAAQVRLGLLVDCFVPEGTIVMGLDETLERRHGANIAAKGMYRDAARSSKTFFVTASGLRGMRRMLLAPIPWAGRGWALPFFTVLAPSERYAVERGKRHKKLTDWARQMVLHVRRWLPDRQLVLVADSSYAVLVLLARCAQLTPSAAVVTRLRLDAALYEPAPPRKPKQNGRPRLKGKRLPPFQPVLDAPTTQWMQVPVPRWDSQGPREIVIVSATCVVPQGHAVRTKVLGSHSRPARHSRATSIGVHRCTGRTGPDRIVVCAPVAGGDNLPSRAHASGRGNTAAVERTRDPAHNAGIARLGFPGDLVRA